MLIGFVAFHFILYFVPFRLIGRFFRQRRTHRTQPIEEDQMTTYQRQTENSDFVGHAQGENMSANSRFCTYEILNRCWKTL